MTRKELLQQAVDEGLAESPAEAEAMLDDMGIDIDEMLVFEGLCSDDVDVTDLIEAGS